MPTWTAGQMSRTRAIALAWRAKVGGILHIERPIHISNVMVVGDDGKATRIGSRKDDAGKNVRVSRRTGKDI